MQKILTFMRIVNPLYDTAFKYLMDNKKLAKKLISAIIDKEILSLEVFPQETAIELKRTKVKPKKESKRKRKTETTISEYLSIYRLDFKAVVKMEDGKEQKILIEVQKSRYPDPIDRFRRYLGANYLRGEKYIDEKGVEKFRSLPIISIYFLGYLMSEYQEPAIFVDNQVFNAVSKKKIDVKNDFVKLLTHQTYIIQVLRIPARPNSRLMKLLTFFDQTHQVEGKDYILNVESNSLNKDFVFHLNIPAESDEFGRKLQLEKEYTTEWERIERELQEEREISQKQAQELQLKDKELQNQRSVIENLVRTLLLSGKSKDEISILTGISISEIEKLS